MCVPSGFGLNSKPVTARQLSKSTRIISYSNHEKINVGHNRYISVIDIIETVDHNNRMIIRNIDYELYNRNVLIIS